MLFRSGQPLLSMREGCAGFFTPRELAEGKGLVPAGRKTIDTSAMPKVPAPPGAGSIDAQGVAALRRGDFGQAFGPAFQALALRHPPRLPGGKLALLDRVPAIDPAGGDFGLGFIAAELNIDADDWHMVCHFVDDRVMPGTLMYEACAQTLRVLMWRWGWLGEEGAWTAEPTPGVTSKLRCRGQVGRREGEGAQGGGPRHDAAHFLDLLDHALEGVAGEGLVRALAA